MISYSEKTGRKWLKRWCLVKNGQLEVFNDSEENPEMSVVLTGCDIQNARVNKRQLAIRLVKEGKELITLDVRLITFCMSFRAIYSDKKNWKILNFVQYVVNQQDVLNLRKKNSEIERQVFEFQTADTLEQGKWLSVLIKESGCGGNRSATSSLEYTYVDDDEGVDAPTAESEDIYDEVYEDKISAIQILTGSGKCDHALMLIDLIHCIHRNTL